MNRPADNAPGMRWLLAGLALAALAFAWALMTYHARSTPWYRQADLNLPALADAAALNAGQAPVRLDRPGMLPAFVLALDWRVRHELGLLAKWNLARLDAAGATPALLHRLVLLEKEHSRVLVLLLILAGAALARAVVPGLESACLAVCFLAGSAALLYHGLIVDPELLACGLGAVLALLFAWRGTTAASWAAHHRGIFLAGLCGGLAALASRTGGFHLLGCYAWCWLAALAAPGPRSGRPGLGSSLLPVASAVLVLWLARQAAETGVPSAVAAERLRGLALLAGLLPLLALWHGSGRPTAFLAERLLEFALLAGGALAALVLARGALHAVLPADAALASWAGLLESLFYPAPSFDGMLASTPEIAREFLHYVRESPFLFAAATGLAATACLLPDVPRRLRAFVALLLASALAYTWLLAHWRFADPAGVGVQVPLLLVCVLAALAAGPWPPARAPRPWLAPLLVTAAVVLLATVPFRLRVKSPAVSPDDNPAVGGPLLTYLYDHHAHPAGYRAMMLRHYRDRMGFEAALRAYLADPAHRL